jgi:predicted nucleic acid-binding protein
MPLFLDACALAKRYIPEGESTRRMQQITGRFDRWGGYVVSSLVEPEVISAFGKYARARTPHEAYFYAKHPRIVAAFRRDLCRPFVTVIPVTDDEVEAAADLLKAHPEYSIGAADAIHLATALALAKQERSSTPFIFVTADRGACGGGAGEGADGIQSALSACRRVGGDRPERNVTSAPSCLPSPAPPSSPEPVDDALTERPT